jgi:hypothetical protein
MPEFKPFSDDVELLEAEAVWIVARCRHIAAVRDHEADDLHHAHRKIMSCCRRRNSAEGEIPPSLGAMHQEEQDIRHEIDARIAATEAAGTPPALVRIVRELDLDFSDRNTLLLALIPVVGTRATDPLEQIGGFALVGAVTGEVAAAFNEWGFRDRLIRMRFDSRHKLVRSGLITADVADDAAPGDWAAVSLKLTARGLAALAGIGTVEPHS